ncbi:response regulator transcription factor [Paenibacillus polymyxa]|uniref:Response regulator transcription factor n=1 Tax=Paenibacillus polymyxa TaxID=1406 RepID=A0A8I1IZR4_PAEPO|nr:MULTISPECIES: LytTR family DNA-binding domain-containing protein [Paenibacillus]KAF6569853.1 response regulator transcription factor [Paenibacillus sp. EKM206P]KAF6585427.1 response regulator transcription factor [Paenibacillus sp. EKM205P]MBM0635675.1 response regulator transcription factor [Paenibacillus polymyxa]
MVIKVAICDDVPVIIKDIENLLLEYDSSLFEIDIFYNPFRLIELLKGNTYDLFILNIEFPNLSGIEIAKTIRKNNYTCPIIFISSFKEYMEQAFKVNPFDYILKPVTKNKLYPALDRAIKYLEFDISKFMFTFNKVFYSLSFNEIIYFEKNKRRVLIHTPTDIYITLLQTRALLSKINDNFVQVHTSFIVNVKYVKKLSNNTIIAKLNDKQIVEIPISRKFIDSARKQITMKLRDLI